MFGVRPVILLLVVAAALVMGGWRLLLHPQTIPVGKALHLSPEQQNSSSASAISGLTATLLWSQSKTATSAYTLQSPLGVLREGERTLISLPSGSQYTLEVNTTEFGQGVQQIMGTVDPDGLPGFALFTIGEDRLFGTLNTPEGVYELVGTQANFTLRRAQDIDAERRLGTDYKVKESLADTALAQDKKLPTDLGPKQ
ncbi:MAG: hypothetical protein P8O79_09690 [Halieaceae bacterium]|nr:hypothetical protein [Halieaceae bacterium]